MSHTRRTLAAFAMTAAFASPAAGLDTDLERALSLAADNRDAQARAVLDPLLVSEGHDPTVRLLHGVLRARERRVNEAIDTFEGLLRDHPEMPEPYNNLAVLRAVQGQLEEARRTLLAGIDLRPDLATAHANLATVYTHMALHASARAKELGYREDPPSRRARATGPILALPDPPLGSHGPTYRRSDPPALHTGPAPRAWTGGYEDPPPRLTDETDSRRALSAPPTIIRPPPEQVDETYPLPTFPDLPVIALPAPRATTDEHEDSPPSRTDETASEPPVATPVVKPSSPTVTVEEYAEPSPEGRGKTYPLPTFPDLEGTPLPESPPATATASLGGTGHGESPPGKSEQTTPAADAEPSLPTVTAETRVEPIPEQTGETYPLPTFPDLPSTPLAEPPLATGVASPAGIASPEPSDEREGPPPRKAATTAALPTLTDPTVAEPARGALCLHAKRFRSHAAANEAQQWLRTRGIEAAEPQRKQREVTSHHIYLLPFPSHREARAKVNEALARGVKDVAVITSGPLENGVSFGVYWIERYARKRIEELDTIGYPIRHAQIPKIVREYEIEARASADVPWREQHAKAWRSQYPRQRMKIRSCRP